MQKSLKLIVFFLMNGCIVIDDSMAANDNFDDIADLDERGFDGTSTHACVCMHTQTHTHTHTHTHTYSQTHTHAHTCTHMLTHTHTHMHK